jgi:endo-1,4-beta-D-glucanase Y
VRIWSTASAFLWSACLFAGCANSTGTEPATTTDTASNTGTTTSTTSSAGGSNDSTASSSSVGTMTNVSTQTETGQQTATGASSSAASSAASSTAAAAWNNPTPATATAKFPFPQNRKGTFCTYPSSAVPVATLNARVSEAFTQWKQYLVSSTGAPSGTMRVVDPQGPPASRTTSEGIGYGMLITVYMNDKTTFDSIWGYAKAHFDGHQLMNWEIDSGGGTLGSGSATDADEDMAWALLMADKQWGGYSSPAQALIGAMSSSGEVSSSNFPNIGDNSPNAQNYYPDYFSPAYYSAFGFTGLISVGYSRFNQLKNATTNLLPDEVNGLQQFAYDACRIPWRIGMDFCFTGSSSAQAFLGPMATYFVGQGVAGMVLPMLLTGGPATGSSPTAAISGPAGVAAMVSAANQSFIDAAFNKAYQNSLALQSGTLNYFGASLGLIAMLVESGNFFDYSNPPQ